MRKPHKLTPNKTKARPRYRVYFDSESRVNEDTLQHTPYLIMACFIDERYNKERWRKYTDDLANFWVDVAGTGGKKEAVTVYAHNAGYDTVVTGGITTLARLGFVVTSFFEKGSTFILRFRRLQPDGKTEKTINIISSTNFYTTTLARLGDVFKIKKLEFDYNTGSLADAVTYCRQDVEILKRAIETFIDFVNTEDLGVMAQTTPGQAFNAYRHRFMPVTISLHDNEVAWEIERGAYYGGRVECWRIGQYSSPGGFYGFDINSMYPYVMKENLYPCKLRTVKLHISTDYLARLLKDYCICAEVTVKTDRPVLPVKLRGNFIYPVGRFRTFLSTPELSYALQHGLIMEVHRAAVYDRADLFSDYVNYFYNKRLEAKAAGNAVYDMLYKLFLNSLYGKFGQKSEDWQRVADAPPEKVEAFEVLNADTGQLDAYKIFGGSIFKRGQEQEAFNSFCAIAAHVTAYARQLLLQYIEAAGWANIYYMDTDSLFVNAAGAAGLQAAGVIDDKRLGAMKLEKEDKQITINAPKDYSFAGVIRMKGIKKSAVYLGDGHYKNIQWPKLQGLIRAGTVDTFANIERIKQVAGTYNKAWLLDTGEVKPFTLLDNVIQQPPDNLHGCGQVERARSRYKECYYDYIEMQRQEAADRQTRLFMDDYRREFRRAVMAAGGVNDGDYENLPRWAKRKTGRPLDELVAELQEQGYNVSNANDLYEQLFI